MGNFLSKFNTDPAYSAQRSENNKKRWNKPGARNTGWTRSPEFRKQVAEKTKLRWELYRQQFKNGEQRDCRVCAKKFIPQNVAQFCCSPECRQEKASKHYDYNIRAKYKIGAEDVENMLVAQNRKCPICDREEPTSLTTRPWHVDHDHKTGKIRGILCRRCNRGLGLFRDDARVLKRAIKYLRKHQEKETEDV